MMELILYIWHCFKLQAIDACLGIYNLTGHVFLPEELLSLLLGVAVVLAILQTVGQSLAADREAERTGWK